MNTICLLAPLPASTLTSQLPESVVVRTPADHGGRIGAATGADIVVADWSGAHLVDAELVAVLAPGAAVLMPAAGVDPIDLDACRAAGVLVAACEGLNATAVAEWVVWALLDVRRGFSAGARSLAAGEWQQLGRARWQVAGATIGLVGLGAIGAEVALLLGGFGCELIYTTRTRRAPAVEERLGVRWVPLDELFRTAQGIVLALPLTEETRGMVDRELLETCRPDAVVVNAARGQVMDAVAAAKALTDGVIHGVATDVFAVEPPPADHPLVSHPMATTTPHIGGVSADAVGAIFARTFANLKRLVDGHGELDGVVIGRWGAEDV